MITAHRPRTLDEWRDAYGLTAWPAPVWAWAPIRGLVWAVADLVALAWRRDR